jgi:hypothetical protein
VAQGMPGLELGIESSECPSGFPPSLPRCLFALRFCEVALGAGWFSGLGFSFVQLVVWFVH